MLIRALTTLLALSVLPATAQDSWSFTPATDTFAAEAILDLRPLNETVAGASGFIRTSADGDDFVRGDGKPIRLWSISLFNYDPNSNQLAPEQISAMPFVARWLAKRGVNAVKINCHLAPKPDAPPDSVNQHEIERVCRWVAALRKEGIYTFIFPYWPHYVGAIPAAWGMEAKTAWGQMFIQQPLQERYKRWLRALFDVRNEHTGNRLADEPAVAMVQITNEDSLLFWTFNFVVEAKGQPYDELRRRFAAWAAVKFGGADKALASWPGEGADDDLAGGMLGLHPMWVLVDGKARSPRKAAQLEFMATVMRDFNVEMVAFLRNDLRCRSLINAGNWRTADNLTLLDAERWSYRPGEVMAMNRYVSAIHEGPDAGWAVNPGDHFTNLSCISDPASLPVNARQPDGHPFIIPESAWVSPNAYQSEGPALVAAYSSLSGVDTCAWFMHDSLTGWSAAKFAWAPKQFKFSFGHPSGIGQFPAAALTFRRAHIRAGDVVVHEERPDADLFAGRTPLIGEESGFDPLRDRDRAPERSSVKTGADPLAFLVGRVEVVYGETADPRRDRMADFTTTIDRAAKTATSTTGELKLDWGRSVFTCDAPSSKTAAGFLGAAGTLTLGEMTVTCANDYATIMAVAMDDQPLSRSDQILIQIGTINRPTGWKEEDAEFAKDGTTIRGKRVTDVGDAPWAVEHAKGTLTIANPGLATATILDANGMAVDPAQGKTADGRFTLTLPADALYVVLAGPGGPVPAARLLKATPARAAGTR